jgi:CRP-like cAMP-binding protein
MSHSENVLLSLLATEEKQALLPHLRTVQMKLGEVLAESHARVELVHFPHDGIISFVVELKNGDAMETGMVGRDGVFGASQALDDKLSLNKVVVQVAGTATVISSEKLHELASQSRPLTALLVKYEQFFLGQVQQSVACNAAHVVEQRMCRWILRMHDLIGLDLPLTQEFLAQMIGVTRSSVSAVAGTLQRAGLISYSRGHIHIDNLDGVRAAACECHEAVVWHHQAIFNPAANVRFQAQS